MTTGKQTDLVLRRADEADLASVLNLYAEPAMDNGRILDVHQARDVFRAMQQIPRYHLYVAELDGNIVGTFALLIMPNLGHMGTPSGIAEDLVVTGTCRGQGIGTAMVAKAIKLCRAAGCYKLMLSSNLKRNQAHTFYESLGFERHGYSFMIRLDNPSDLIEQPHD